MGAVVGAIAGLAVSEACSHGGGGGGDVPTTMDACRLSAPDLERELSAARCFRFTAEPGGIEQTLVLSPDVESEPTERSSTDYLRERIMRFAHKAPPSANAELTIPYGLHWNYVESGALYLHWTNGNIGGAMCLGDDNDGLSGVLVEDADYGSPAVRRIALNAIACDD